MTRSEEAAQIRAELARRIQVKQEGQRQREREERDALRRRFARTEMLPYVRLTHDGYQAGTFQKFLCRTLEWFSSQVEKRKAPRLLVSAPPRHGKTAIISQRFPVWHMARTPGSEIACASYGQELADDNSREARTIARSDETIRVFGDGVLPAVTKRRWKGDYQRGDVDKITMWKMGNGSSYKAVGVTGPLTGRGADILIIDDPFKDNSEARSSTRREAVWDWYTSTARTRVAPGGGVIVMATRWDQDDLIGRLERQMADNPEADQFRVINLPAFAGESPADYDWRKPGEALHPERWSAKELRQIRASIGAYWWRALYLGRPTSATGGLFKRAWFNRYAIEPWVIVHQMGEVAMTVDCTFKGTTSSDRVSIQIWGRHAEKPQHFYLLDDLTDQMTFTETVRAIGVMAKKWPMAHLKLIEDTANGPAVINLLDGRFNGLTPFSPGKYGSKPSRAQSASVAVEAGQVFLPVPEYFRGVEDWMEEIADFGEGARFDDRVDAFSQMIIRWMMSVNPMDQVNDALGWLNDM